MVNCYIFVNGVGIYKFKTKESEINTTPLCLDKKPKGFSVDYMKKTGLCKYVYVYLVCYDNIDVVGFISIQKYLMI